MRIGIIAPPFISVPPPQYGGTELFIANLAIGLEAAGVEVVLYTNGESTLPVERKWLYPQSDWPIKDDAFSHIRDLEHHAWAVADATRDCDLLHVNNVSGLSYSRFVPQPFLYTVHHAEDAALLDVYRRYPEVHYACISAFQSKTMELPNCTTIHHGIDASLYRVGEGKRDYLAFLGRIAPVKGVHLAIEAAKKAGIPLKIAGQVQPLFQDYWKQVVEPQVDGKFIEFVGELDLEGKNQLLGGARAMLFPIQWDEPFGLVMVESMACGAPVLAFRGGSVAEVVEEGVSGHICADVAALADRAVSLNIPAAAVRRYVEEKFSVARMTAGYIQLYERALSSGSLARPTLAETGTTVL